MENKFYFGCKVRLVNKSRLRHDNLDNCFCLLGFNSNAFALIEWNKKGEYDFKYFIGNVDNELKIISE